MSLYYRPIVRTGPRPASGALDLAGGWCWFDMVEVLARGADPYQIPALQMPEDWLRALTMSRATVAGLALNRPRIMGILNVTPDSFSDGGLFETAGAAVHHGAAMRAQGADILDIGGESTRPGADFVPAGEETARVVPVIERLAAHGDAPLSVDTRKADVAHAAVQAGAKLVNDVSGLQFDPAMAAMVAKLDVSVCLMHAQGDPTTMQVDPRYDDALLDVFDALEAQVAQAVSAGIDKSRILLDPGIGFGKTLAHNLQLLRRVSLFHGLGCGLLLGVSRKSFIGALSGEKDATGRLPGSLASGLDLVAQGVQLLRVHDMPETRQALDIWLALNAPDLSLEEA